MLEIMAFYTSKGFIPSFIPCVTAKPGGRIRCQYVPTVDKVLFVDDYAVGCRKDLNGILLLDTALQPPVGKPEDLVHLELPVTEVRGCESFLFGLNLRGGIVAKR